LTATLVAGCLALVVLSLLVACGDDDESGAPGASPPEATVESTPSPPATLPIRAGAVEGDIFIRAFMPADLELRVGDTATWTVEGGPHTVTFLVDQEPFALIVPDPTSPADVILNPRVVEPSPNPPATTYDGVGFYNSGLLEDGDAAQSITFTAPGSFDYLCLVHPRMSGTIEVTDNLASELPSPGQIEEETTEELNSHLEEAVEALGIALEDGPETSEGPNESTVWQILTGLSTDHADVRRFIPDSLDIAPGDTVVWLNEALEPHTVTFGEPPVYLIERTTAAGGTRLVLNPDILNVALGGFEFIEGEFFHSGLLVEGGPLGVMFELLFPDAGVFLFVDSLYPELMQGELRVGQ
jgi:plastocyanin